MRCRCHDYFCYCEKIAINENKTKHKPKLTKSEIEDLYKYLEHGGDEHRVWLRSALYSYFLGLDKPEYR